jgi:hypothetical protein
MTQPDVSVEGTPNPNAAKFVVRGAALGAVSRSYFEPAEAEADALASRLFAISGIRALLIVDNFITVTKADEVAWDDIVEDITWIIGEALGS